ARRSGALPEIERRRAIVSQGVESRYVWRSPGRNTPLVVLPLLLVIALPDILASPESPAPSSLPSAAEGLVRSGLKDLHDGLYAKAEGSFRGAALAAPGDPEPDLFIAFTLWWRMIQNRSDRT